MHGLSVRSCLDDLKLASLTVVIKIEYLKDLGPLILYSENAVR